MPRTEHPDRVDAIELDVDPNDPELLGAVADVVDGLTTEHQDLADPMTAFEADRRIATDMPDATIEYQQAGLLDPPVWRIRRDGND
jgi:hypothetical protein